MKRILVRAAPPGKRTLFLRGRGDASTRVKHAEVTGALPPRFGRVAGGGWTARRAGRPYPCVLTVGTAIGGSGSVLPSATARMASMIVA